MMNQTEISEVMYNTAVITDMWMLDW